MGVVDLRRQGVESVMGLRRIEPWLYGAALIVCVLSIVGGIADEDWQLVAIFAAMAGLMAASLWFDRRRSRRMPPPDARGISAEDVVAATVNARTTVEAVRMLRTAYPWLGLAQAKKLVDDAVIQQ